MLKKYQNIKKLSFGTFHFIKGVLHYIIKYADLPGSIFFYGENGKTFRHIRRGNRNIICRKNKMKILNFYVVKSFISTFLMALGILSFGMAGARLMKVFQYISSGVPAENAFLFLVYVLPIVFSFTIPWAALVSVMLVFGRLSADNEITAMRACGVSILQITAPIIVLAFLFSVICLYLNMELSNRYLGKARALVRNVIIDQPMSIFEPGIPVKYADLNIYIGAKEGNVIRDIQVYRMGKKGKWEQDVTAHTGKVEVDRERQVLHVILNNATVATHEGKENIVTTTGKQLVFSINYGDNFNKRKLLERDKFLPSLELLARIGIEKQLGRDTTKQEVQFNSRIALALSPIAFLLLGLPLAIRTSRRETSVGLFLSVLLAGVYFGIIMLAEVLDEKKSVYPQYIIWIAPVLYQIFGAVYLFKLARR